MLFNQAKSPSILNHSLRAAPEVVPTLTGFTITIPRSQTAYLQLTNGQKPNFNSYLGIGIEEFNDGSWQMTQKGLIKKLLQTTDMLDYNQKWCSTTQTALGSDPEGEPYDGWDASCLFEQQHLSSYHLSYVSSCKIHSQSQEQ